LPGRGNNHLRLLDRYLGMALVFALGTFRQRRSAPTRPEKIGLLNTAAVGDTILLSGPVADLRAAYRNAEIIFLAGPSNYEAARLVDHVDRVIKLPVFNPLASVKAVREQRVDMLLDFGPWSRLNALLTIFSRSQFTVGFRTRGQGRHFGYDLAVEHSPNVHELENHRRIIRALGLQVLHRPSLQCKPSDCQAADDSAAPFIVFHLWPGGTAARHKEWPIARWVALAEHLAGRHYRIVFTGSDKQRRLNDAVMARIRAPVRPFATNAAGSSLNETLQLLSRAELVVSVDTGIMHMAAALGAPLVVLHGPSSATRWGPISEYAIVVESPLGACGYLNLGFETPRNAPPCMEAICYESVRTACTIALRRAYRKRVAAVEDPPPHLGLQIEQFLAKS
jgi:heptosyltransferase I